MLALLFRAEPQNSVKKKNYSKIALWKFFVFCSFKNSPIMLRASSLLSARVRLFSTTPQLWESAGEVDRSGLVVGLFEEGKFTKEGAKLPKRLRDRLLSAAELADMKGKTGESVMLLDPKSPHPRIALVGLGSQASPEDIRKATAAGVKNLVQNGATKIDLDPICGNSSVEGASLALYEVDQWKSDKKNKEIELSLPTSNLREKERNQILEGWRSGVVASQAQQFSRSLMETPANLLTPSAFAERVSEELGKFDCISVQVHGEEWIKEHKMGGVLGVNQGSSQEPKFLEIDYTPEGASNEQPIILIGKGVTFDSGGISIKPSAGMGMMKGDMGGAAVVAGVMHGLGNNHYHQIQENPSISLIGGVAASECSSPCFSPPPSSPVKALIPLVENMPSGTAIRPGDVLTMMNGKTVEVDNTDAEGRLILADALTYAQKFNPKAMLDIATLTGAMAIALGEEYTGTFSSSDLLWESINKAGKETGEKMWHMPLDDAYFSGMKSTVADMRNAGPRVAGACTAAIFLKQFVEKDVKWAHLDIAGVMHSESGSGYHPKGMTGTPTRTLLKFALDHVSEQ